MDNWWLVLVGYGVAWFFYVLPERLDDRQRRRNRPHPRTLQARGLGYADGSLGLAIDHRDRVEGDLNSWQEDETYRRAWEEGMQRYKLTRPLNGGPVDLDEMFSPVRTP